ncbi:MAG: hypothetical protein M0Z91_11490 [Actinomycetota bacterium]|nr:hypothetical protein [Actinomycetota bacterium]
MVPGEGGFAQGQLEVLGHLALVDHLAETQSDLAGTGQAAFIDCGDDR